LFHFLNQHPEICMPCRKETHFFDKFLTYDNGCPNYDVYHSLFFPTKKSKILGDATPIYMYWEPAIREIHKYNPKMKWIILLRNPVSRAYSHYIMETQRGRETLSFREALEAEEDRISNNDRQNFRIFSYKDRGHYLRQIKCITNYFPRSQLLILLTQDLRNRHYETFQKVSSFLNVNHYPDIKSEFIHHYNYDEIGYDEKTYLNSYYKDEIKKLGDYLGVDLKNWED